MEKFPNQESNEKFIDVLIETLAEKEGMSPEDIQTDIVTFAEICETDDDAKGYFEQLADEINISPEAMIEYARQKAKEQFEE
jgi:hypothetical protein